MRQPADVPQWTDQLELEDYAPEVDIYEDKCLDEEETAAVVMEKDSITKQQQKKPETDNTFDRIDDNYDGDIEQVLNQKSETVNKRKEAAPIDVKQDKQK